MARIQLELPEKFIFKTELEIRISEINYGGHLGNDAFLSLMHEARVRFLKEYGYGELDVEGVGIIVSDCAIVYKAEGFHGQNLAIEVTPYDFNKFGFDLFYKISEKTTNKELARAKTNIVFFNYKTKKITPIPEKAKEKWDLL